MISDIRELGQHLLSLGCEDIRSAGVTGFHYRDRNDNYGPGWSVMLRVRMACSTSRERVMEFLVSSNLLVIRHDYADVIGLGFSVLDFHVYAMERDWPTIAVGARLRGEIS